MKKLTLRQRILNYLRSQHPSYVMGIELERLIAEKTKYKPSTGARVCRQLEEDGLIEKSELQGGIKES